MNKQNKKERKVFLEDLPKVKGNRGLKNKLIFDWGNYNNQKVRFIYDDIEGWLEIKNYNCKERTLTIIYNNEEYVINVNVFKKCGLGNILGKYTSEFKIDIGTRFQDDKRDITIIDRKKDDKGKYYKYKCNKCGFDCGKHYSSKKEKYEEEYWTEESGLLHGVDCACCLPSSNIVVKHINSMSITSPWIINYLKNKDDVYKYTCKSNKKVWFKCIDCGFEKEMRICDFNRRGISCKRCGDSISTPNKFAFNVLYQLQVDFESEYSPDWCKYEFKNKYRQGFYDFYFKLNNKEYILEMDGGFHTKDNNKSGQTKEESKFIDDYKDKLAIEHGIEVIRIDCDYCNYDKFKYIKQNILEKDKLNELFDLSKIDWDKVNEFACSNRVKEACVLWNGGIRNAINIGKLMKLSDVTITKYLQKGKELNWCLDYDAKNILSERSRKNGLANGKQIEIFKDKISLGVFESGTDLARKSEELFGVKLNQGHISDVCLGIRKQHKGYTFKYVEEKEAC
jgi:very-short-patch-repair endonuclease